MTNQIVSVKKNTERIKICILFFISLIYLGNAIATNNNFFSILFKFISTFFSPQFQEWHCHKLCTFFCFCLQHFRIRISYLCLESTYFFFLFLFTSLQNKNLYLSLQCTSQNKNIVLEITLPIYQGTFTIKERYQPNCFGERLTTFFYISPLFRQCHCHNSILLFFCQRRT